MLDEGKLSSVLSESARTLATDFPIQHILDHLVGQLVGTLDTQDPGCRVAFGHRCDRAAS